MDSRESLHNHQPHHHQQLPPGMMMPPNPYNTNHHHHLSNNSNNSAINNNNANMMSPNSMQQRFPFNSSDQYGDGSSPSGGFRASGYNIESAKKKRGRPRKYSPSSDGNIALGLAPTPINAVSNVATAGGNLESSNDGSGGTPNPDSSAKKHRGRPPGSVKKQLDALGSHGVGFTPHVIVVKPGEDIASTLVSFSQQGPRTICILSANGAVSNVTLRQPATSGGIVTYEGRFEIISLSGSFVHSESDSNHNKASGLSVSLAGSDGRVLGGGVAGMLVAASPVQIIVGSFISDAKKSKTTAGPSPVAPPNMLSFGGGGGGGVVPGASPPSDGPSSESSDESGSSSLHRMPPASYNNATQQHHHHHHQQQQQQLPPQPMQNHPMYSNMGWPSSTMNMLPN